MNGAIGRRIRELRVRRGFTQQQLADLSGVGVMAISAIERGQANPKIDTLERIAHALTVTLPKLLEVPIE